MLPSFRRAACRPFANLSNDSVDLENWKKVLLALRIVNQ